MKLRLRPEENMRICVITFHDTLNFGATLQCTAMSRFLAGQGHDVKVINYLPDYVMDKKSTMKEIRNIGRSSNKAKALVKGFAYLAKSGDIKKKNRCYEKFLSDNVYRTDAYHTFDELVKNPPEADLYICGSDQIWNPALTGGKLDPAFFLKFAEGRKAAYGVSVGELDINSEAEELKEMTADMAGVSVREKSVAVDMAFAIERDVDVVLDPTLLLDKKDYMKMESASPVTDKPYLLLYNVQNSKESVGTARKIAAERGLEIIDISPNPFAKVDGVKKLLDIGPGEFLRLFDGADYVVTNSFHGTVFSVIYEKEFWALGHSKRAGRTYDLLDSLHLLDRFIKEPSEAEGEPIDYSEVMKLLSYRRAHSVDYINSLL